MPRRVSSSRLTVAGLIGFAALVVPVAAPLPRQPFPLELLDPMRRDLVQDERAERPIQHLQDLPVAIDAPLVELRMVASGTSSANVLNVMSGCWRIPWRPSRIARPLLRLDLLRVLLVRGLGRVPVPLPVDAEVVEPVMLTLRRRRTVQRVSLATCRRLRLCRATEFSETHSHSFRRKVKMSSPFPPSSRLWLSPVVPSTARFAFLVSDFNRSKAVPRSDTPGL